MVYGPYVLWCGLQLHHQCVAIPVAIGAKYIMHPYELIDVVAIPVACPGAVCMPPLQCVVWIACTPLTRRNPCCGRGGVYAIIIGLRLIAIHFPTTRVVENVLADAQ